MIQQTGLLPLDADNNRPYCISVKNTTNEVVSDFKMLSAFEFIGHEGFKNGILTMRGVDICSIIPDVSYHHILWEIATKGMYVSNTLLISVSGCLPDKMVIETLNAKGSKIHIPVSTDNLGSSVKNFELQESAWALRKDYELQGGTSLIFPQIPPLATFNIFIYPITNPLYEKLDYNLIEPIRISVKNNSDKNFETFNIFESMKYAYKNIFKKEYEINTEIEVYGTKYCSYEQLLSLCLCAPLKIFETRIKNKFGNSPNAIKIISTNIENSIVETELPTVIIPNFPSVLSSKVEYELGFFSHMVISNVPANSEFEILLYVDRNKETKSEMNVENVDSK